MRIRRYTWSQWALCLAFAALLAGVGPARRAGAEDAPPPASASGRDCVLILNSHQQGLPVPDGVVAGILNALKARRVSVDDVFVENLDLLRFDSPQQRARVASLLRAKLAGIPIRLIFTVTTPALDFLANEGRDLFPDAPVLAATVPSGYQWKGPPRRLAILPWRLDCAGTLRYALDLFPDTRRVVVVADSQDKFLPSLPDAKEDFAPWEDTLTFEYTDQLTYEEMMARLESLPPETVVIYAPYFADRTGRSFIPFEIAAKVARAADAPVFALIDIYVGSGVVGGRC